MATRRGVSQRTINRVAKGRKTTMRNITKKRGAQLISRHNRLTNRVNKAVQKNTGQYKTRKRMQ